MGIKPTDIAVNVIMICITAMICRAIFPTIVAIPGMPEFTPWVIMVCLGGTAQILAIDIRNRIELPKKSQTEELNE